MITDPYRILGVSPLANDKEIRAAYLKAVSETPPERDREKFERIRAAYESVVTEHDRLRTALFDKTPPTQEDLLDAVSQSFVPRRPSEDRVRRLLCSK